MLQRRVSQIPHVDFRFEFTFNELQLRSFYLNVQFSPQHADFPGRRGFNAIRGVRFNVDGEEIVCYRLDGGFYDFLLAGLKRPQFLSRFILSRGNEEFNVFGVAVANVANAKAEFILDSPFNRIAPFNQRLKNGFLNLDVSACRHAFKLEITDQFKRDALSWGKIQFQRIRLIRSKVADVPHAPFGVRAIVDVLNRRGADLRLQTSCQNRFRQYRRHYQTAGDFRSEITHDNLVNRFLPDGQLSWPDSINFDNRSASCNVLFVFSNSVRKRFVRNLNWLFFNGLFTN